MLIVGIVVIMFITACVAISFYEIRDILQSVKLLDLNPIPVGENYTCPTCKAFWYMRDEEVHFKGCIVPIVRATSNATKIRSGSNPS